MRRLSLISIGILLVTGAAWFWIDMAPDDRVVPGVVFDGTRVGRMPESELRRVVERTGEDALDTPVVVTFGSSRIETDARALGIEVDTDATVDAVLERGRTTGFLGMVRHWLSSVGSSTEVSAVLMASEDEIAAALAGHPDAIAEMPAEPEIGNDAGLLVVEPGVTGLRVDDEAAAAMIVEVFHPGAGIEVAAPMVESPPVRSDAQAVAFADELNAKTSGGVTVTMAGTIGRLSAGTLREHLEIEATATGYEYRFDAVGIRAALVALFSDVSEPGEPPTFDVVDGMPQVVEPGTPPLGCCSDESGEILVDHLENGGSVSVAVPGIPVGDPVLEAWAAGEGVSEVVGTFTTEHACCQGRVENIHRIADLVRGVVLLPGERFSVNEFVGERTMEKGFVPAGVIERGRFQEDVGGGISQFATTLFNAAFFAGLELEEYQSHSIYISRYPYGREATLSYPLPDLVVGNTTEHPVLLWTSYTDTSITVTIYSTKHIQVEEAGQERSPFGKCTQVETFRRRTYPDGTTVDDSVEARYRPGEGLDCNGNPTPGG